jgi:hypothetical protein
MEAADEFRLPRPTATVVSQQPKTKRRTGSLRKAVLGREAQREKRDAKPLSINTGHSSQIQLERQVNGLKNTSTAHAASDSEGASESSEVTPWPELDDAGTQPQPQPQPQPELVTSPTVSYKSTSTTDEEDGLHMPQPNALHRQELVASSATSYFTGRSLGQAGRKSQAAKSPLSYADSYCEPYVEVGLATVSSQAADQDWDYSETEWWGWLVLVVTWFIFVTGMGSCFGVWSWAWDVGTTPYAPPELENDETLPIVGYYPALLILTGVMSWIWVIVAWVGMKYFRHAKITGD